MADPKNKRISNGLMAVQVRNDTLDEGARTVEIVWSTGAAVKRYSWDDGYYMEELSMDPKSVDLARMNAGASFLDTHDQWAMSSRLGAVVPGSARIEKGLGVCTIQISRNPEGERIMTDLRDGMPLPISVGYRIHAYEKTEGDENALPTYTATRWEPLEVSAVPVPADPGAYARSLPQEKAEIYEVPVTVRGGQSTAGSPASQPKGKTMTPEEIAAKAAEKARNEAATSTETTTAGTAAGDDTGTTETTTTETTTTETTEAGRSAPAVTTAVVTTPASQLDVQAAVRAALDAERVRSETILQMATAHRIAPDIAQAAIRANKTVEEFRAIALDEIRKANEANTVFSVHAVPRQDDPSMNSKRNDAIVGALLHRIQPGKFQIEGDSRLFAHSSLLDVARSLLEMQGVDCRGLSKNDLAKRAFHTTSDFPMIMDQTVQRLVRESYRAAPQRWRPLGNQVTAPDFKPMQSMTTGEFGDLQKVNEHGEFKRTTMTMGGQQWGLATYGLIFGVTRQALINDHIGLFAQIPRKFNNAVVRTESNLVWDIFLTNPKMADGKALFHADHKNQAASGSALSITSLSEARLAMRRQKSDDGKHSFPVTPRYLVVPPELETLATQVLYGVVNATTLADAVPEYVRNLTLVVEDSLTDPKAWYLVADPNETDTFEYAYLEGENGPFTETRTGFDVDGQEFKVRLDFGAAPQDFRGFYKNPGV